MILTTPLCNSVGKELSIHSINGARATEYPYGNTMNLDPCLKQNTKINSKWMIDLKCKRKSNKLSRR